MIEYLLGFSKYAQFSDIAVLLAYLFLVSRKTAFAIVLLFACVLGVLHIFWEMFLFKLLHINELRPIVASLWYVGFAATDFVYVMLAVSFCNKMNLTRDLICNFILFTYLVLGILQVLRYLDRIIIQTDVLGVLYKNLIPSLNLAVSTAAIFYLIKVVLTYSKERKESPLC